MAPEAALDELRRNSGSQFDPRVVAAMEHVARSSQTMDDPQYTDALRAVLGGARSPEPIALTV
jgi:HD-GYP domain-containing protein (c-di-GMP phosphodiesterase class II)